MQRNAMYRDKECQSLKQFEEHKEEELAELRAELAAKEEEVAQLRAGAGRRGGAPCLRTNTASPQRAHEDSARTHAGARPAGAQPQL